MNKNGKVSGSLIFVYNNTECGTDYQHDRFFIRKIEKVTLLDIIIFN